MPNPYIDLITELEKRLEHLSKKVEESAKRENDRTLIDEIQTIKNYLDILKKYTDTELLAKWDKKTNVKFRVAHNFITFVPTIVAIVLAFYVFSSVSTYKKYYSSTIRDIEEKKSIIQLSTLLIKYQSSILDSLKSLDTSHINKLALLQKQYDSLVNINRFNNPTWNIYLDSSLYKH
jgi:hypothetical protein